MKFHLRQIVFLMSVLLLVTLSACSQLQDSSPLLPATEEPVPPAEAAVTEDPEESVELPTITAAPEDADPQEEPPQEVFINLDDLELFELPISFDTYQVNIQSDLVEVNQELTADVNNLTASSITILESKPIDPEMAQTVNQIRTLNGFVTLFVDGACTVNNDNAWGFKNKEDRQINFFDHMLPSKFLVGNAVLTGEDVEVNGRITNRFSLSVENFDRGTDAPFRLNELDHGELFVDVETGTLVQVVIEGLAVYNTLDLQGSGPFTYILNNQNFDQPLEIDFQPECGPEPDTQYPIFEPILAYTNDPENEFFEITVRSSMDEVAEFYRSALKADNWTLKEEANYGGPTLYLTFANGSGKNLSVDLMAATTDGENSIITVTLSLLPW